MTEEANPAARNIHAIAIDQVLRMMNSEDLEVPRAVGQALPQIEAVVAAIVLRLRDGGRLHYLGAGTSGLLAALDAAECPSTFGVDPSLVRAHLPFEKDTTQTIGPEGLLIDSASEDRQDLAEAQVKSQISPSDAVIGVSVSGRTPYTVAGIRAASGLGAFTAALTSSRISPLSQAADLTIEVQTGPEVVAGSTRLKAGTAQKLVLNMISTATFVAMGHVYGGWMVDVEAGNAKQRDRALHIVTQLTEAPEPIVKRSLREAGGSAKVAVLMLKKGVSATEARARLEARNGDLGASLEWP